MTHNLKEPDVASILIIDEDVEKSIRTLGKNEKNLRVEVKTGQEALTQASHRSYDLVLLARNQPDSEACSLLHALKKAHPHSPIIILSSMLERQDKFEFLNCGAFDFLKKPYSEEEFKDIIRRALDFKVSSGITEEAIRGLITNAERYRSILQASQDAIILGDHEGTILSWNQAAQNMFGYPAEEVIGKSLTILMPHRYRQAHQEGIKRLQSTGETRVVGKVVELHGLKKGGEEFPIELSLSRSAETKEIFYCGIIRNISDRKKAEALLRQRNSLLALDAEIGQIINLQAPICDLLQRCAEAIMRRIDAALVRIWMFNVADHVLELQASAGLYTHLDGPHSRVPVGELKIGKIASERRPYLTNTVVGDPLISEQEWAKSEDLVAFAGIPLMTDHEVFGVLALFSRHPLSNLTMQSLTSVADRLTTALGRHRAFDMKEKANRLNERILASLGEGIYGLNLEGKTTFVNPLGAKMLGYTIEELLGTSMHDRVHHTKADGTTPYSRMECPIFEAFKDGKVQRVDDEVFWRKDGTSLPVAYTSTPMWENGRLAGAVVTFQDLTEHKKAQERFRLLFEAGPCGMIMIDRQGNIVLANQLVTSLFGYSGKELTGQRVEVLVPARFRPQHTGHREQFFADPQARAMGLGRDLYGRRKDGSEFPLEVGLSPLVTGEDTFFLAAVVDITERKRLAAQLIEEAKLAEVTRIVGDIGHDIKNMLMPVLNGAKLVEEELEEHFATVTGIPMEGVEASRNFTKEALEMVVNNAQRIHDRVREIVTAVKGITSPLCLEPCQIADIVEDVYTSLRFTATEKGVSLRARGLDSLPAIHADNKRLFNAFYNLINNAIPETPVDGVVTVVGSVGDPGKTVVIRVADTGRGMPPEIRDRLFTKGAISGKQGGTGLGTKIVKDVMDAHGGSITVDSEQGKGTTFTMELPIHCQPG